MRSGRSVPLFGSVDLLTFLVIREIQVRYRRSVLGLFWALVQPLPLVFVLFVVFAGTLGSDLPNYPVYVLSGIIYWSFFQHAILSALNSLHKHGGLLRQLPVPAGAFPASAVLASAVHFLLSLLGLLVALVALGSPLRPALAFLPVSMLLIVTFSLGVGLLLSPLSLLFSDVNEAATLILGLLAYLTPVFYPASIVPPAFRWVILANPLTALLDTVRDPIYLGTLPSVETLAIASLSSALAMTVGLASFQSQRRRIPFHA